MVVLGVSYPNELAELAVLVYPNELSDEELVEEPNIFDSAAETPIVINQAAPKMVPKFTNVTKVRNPPLI